MKINRSARAEAKTIFRICRSENGLDESRLRKAVVLIAKQRPRGYLQVLGRLAQLAKLEVERHTHEVISSVQLEDGGKAVFALLVKHFGKPLAQRTEVRSELLGG